MPQKITDDELLARVDSELRQAQDYMGGKLAVQRRKALQYYMAQPEGDLAPPEVEGRSTVVATDVADTVEWMLPSLLKIFTASDRVVQLTPRKQGMEQTAEDATDYLNWIFTTQNNGFQCLHTQFKDALISKVGVLKVYWDDRKDEAREEYEGLSDQELAELLQDEEVEPIEHAARPDEDDAKHRQDALQQLTQQGQQAQQAATQGNPQAQQAVQKIAQQIQSIQAQPPVMLHDVTVKRVRDAAQVRIEPVPPEEFFISRAAKRISDSPFCAHVLERSVSDLRAEGYKIADDELPMDEGAMVGRSMERAQRWSYDDSTAPYPNLIEPANDPSMRRVWVVEAYFRADVDGDGIAEWRRLLKCGSKILDNVECDGPPFVSITPIPMPHRFVGLSVADLAMPAQFQKTALQRAVHDNLFLSVNERYYAVEGQVNLDDLLTSRPGGVVRVKSQGAVGPLSTRSGDLPGAYQLLEYVETQKEGRVGFTHNSRGADQNALHPTATGQVQITNRDDMRMELIARVFAETGIKDLFVRMLELVCRYQHKPAEFRLNGRWLNINPREWRHQFDVCVNVGLGTNDTAQKLQQITQLMQAQHGLSQSPIGAPLVSPDTIYAGMSEFVKALGFKDSDRFVKNPQNQPPAPPQPNPEMLKAQATHQLQQDQHQFDIAKAQADDQRAERDAQRTMQLEQWKQEQQSAQIQHQNELEAQRKTLEAQQQAQLADMERQHQAALKQYEIDRRAEVEMQKARMDNETRVIVAQIAASKGQGEAAEPAAGNTPDMAGALADALQGFKEALGHLSRPKIVVRDTEGRVVGLQ